MTQKNKTGWIVPYSWIDKRITSFQWFSQEPPGGIKANMDGNIFTILEGHNQGCKIYVEEGIITNYVNYSRLETESLPVKPKSPGSRGG